jgi:putative membrane protein
VAIREQRGTPDSGKALLAGAIAGVIGTIAMDAFQLIWSRHAGRAKPHGAQTLRTGGPLRSRSERRGPPADPAEKLAALAVESVSGEVLSPEERHHGGTVVHFGYGTATAAVYGLLADYFPAVTAGAGSAYGLAIWVGADLVAMPVLGLSRKPHEYSGWIALYGAATHVVYGVATELARRRLRDWL